MVQPLYSSHISERRLLAEIGSVKIISTKLTDVQSLVELIQDTPFKKIGHEHLQVEFEIIEFFLPEQKSLPIGDYSITFGDFRWFFSTPSIFQKAVPYTVRLRNVSFH